MNTLEEQIVLKIPAEEPKQSNSENHSSNPGLRALLSIKNFSITLQKDYIQLLQLQTGLEQVNKNGLLMIEANCTPAAIEKWNLTVADVNSSVARLNEILNAAKEKIENQAMDDGAGLWLQLALQIKTLKESGKKSGAEGLELLPENLQSQWENDFLQVQQPLLQSMITHIESCRVLLQMIERYTPGELNKITMIIADQVPPDFTYEEALLYQKDYYKALVNFKNEFKEEKNLWDKFLDILAGGTHQPPSERVMMERWLEGEKGDL